jgi:hypothetical protein
MDDLIEGKLYFFFAGDGFAWIGRFVRRDGPFGAVFSDNVMLCRTNNVSWAEAARGRHRDRCTFESYRKDGDGNPVNIPHIKVLAPFPWNGDLPV